MPPAQPSAVSAARDATRPPTQLARRAAASVTRVGGLLGVQPVGSAIVPVGQRHRRQHAERVKQALNERRYPTSEAAAAAATSPRT